MEGWFCSQSATLISIALLQAWRVQKHAGVFTAGPSLSLLARRWVPINNSSTGVWMSETEKKPMCSSVCTHGDQSAFDARELPFYRSDVLSWAVESLQVFNPAKQDSRNYHDVNAAEDFRIRCKNLCLNCKEEIADK